MQYYLYATSARMLEIDYAARDEAAGIIGSLRGVPAPLASADTYEAITEMAYARLGRTPSDILYIADANGLLYEIVTSRQYHDECEAIRKTLVVAWTCFVLTVISFIATLVAGFGYLGLLLMVGSIALYLGMERSKLFNEIEAGVICVILVLLAALMVPTIHKLQSRTNHRIHERGEAAGVSVGDVAAEKRRQLTPRPR